MRLVRGWRDLDGKAHLMVLLVVVVLAWLAVSFVRIASHEQTTNARLDQLEFGLVALSKGLDDFQKSHPTLQVPSAEEILEQAGLKPEDLFTIGPMGETGPQGPQGPPGEKGDKGDKGEPGISGVDGIPGLQGDRGPEGVRGPNGPMGESGPAGLEGPVGPAGPQGPQGETGPQGEQGPAGPQGEQGPAGSSLTADQIAALLCLGGYPQFC